MYALVIDAEFVGLARPVEVVKAIREGGRIEVASFDASRREWVPVCLEKFELARAA